MASHIVTLSEMGNVQPLSNPVLWHGSLLLVWLMQNVYGRVTTVMEPLPDPGEPVLFAMNHTHKFDFAQSKAALYNRAGVVTVSYTKTRAYQNRLQGAYINRSGNIPITSRGYLISADFAVLHDRAPEEEEYRMLRTHIDEGSDLPDTPTLRAVLSRPRDMLGKRFEPSRSTYRQAIEACYVEAMAACLSLSRQVVLAGHSLHIYPQGVFSTRLTPGRIGAVQLAAGLDIPIVPMGCSGMNAAFPFNSMVPHGGRVKLCFGEPYRINRPELDGFEPFVPVSERRLRPVLEEETGKLMHKINGLLDEHCTWGDAEGDGIKGVARFFD